MAAQRTIFLAVLALMVAACGEQSSEPVAVTEPDPMVQQALNDRLMTDPDLAFQNEANAALTVNFDHSIPPIDAGPEALVKVREEARIRLIENGEVLDLPEGVKDAKVASLEGAMNAQERAALLPATRDCANSLAYSAIWAARLPDFAEIVPRGAVVEAAGTDSAPCRLRVVTYRTPLPPEEALQFHYTLLDRAGLKPRHVAVSETEQALQGARRSAHATIHARTISGGLTEVDIVTLERS